jgi:hypothetical protein
LDEVDVQKFIETQVRLSGDFFAKLWPVPVVGYHD